MNKDKTTRECAVNALRYISGGGLAVLYVAMSLFQCTADYRVETLHTHTWLGEFTALHDVLTENDGASDFFDNHQDTGEGGLSPSSPACPPEMALVGGAFCMDRTEAALDEENDGNWEPASPYLTVDNRVVRAVVSIGRIPQGYISGHEAATACSQSGKRLCTSAEWRAACEGAEGYLYPYGNAYQKGACNDTYAGGHPLVDFFGTNQGVWDSEHMNDPGINQQPGTLTPSGGHPGCVTADGIYDLHGNLHEWVVDEEGVFRGGFYGDAALNGEGCTYRTKAHAMTYHDYSTGFRCCRDVE